MNPGSVFGSGFGQPQFSSPFGAAAGSGSGTSPAFGTNTGFTSSGSGAQVFGSVSTSTTSFGTGSGGGTGFGTTPGFGSSSSNAFGSSGLTSSSSGSSAPAFGTSMPTAGSLGSGTMNQNTGFGSGGMSGTGFGMSSGFGSGTASSSGTGSTGAQFGSGFNKGTTFAALSSASSVFGTTSTGSGGTGPPFGGGGFGGGATALATGGGSTFGTGSSGFGTSSSTVASASGTPGFGAGSSGFGTGSTGFGTGSTGFGTGTPGFGTGSATTPGFGTASTNSGGFGTGSTSTGGFGTGSTSTGGFGTGSTSTGGFGTGSTSTGGFGTGSAGFGTSTTGFGIVSASTPGFGTISTPSSTAAPAFGTTAASGFGGGSSVFGSFTSAQDTSATQSAAQSQSRSTFGGSSIFGAKTGEAGQGFTSGSGATLSSQVGSSVFGSKVSSSGQEFGGGPSSVFGQIPASIAVGSSVTKSSVFGTNLGTVGTSVSTAGTGFSGAQTTSVFGAPPQTGQGAFQTSSAGSSDGMPPPSYSTAIGSGQPGVFATPSAANAFGGASKTQSGAGSMFGGLPKTTSAEGSMFGGASRAQTGAGSTFGVASSKQSGPGSAFGGASKTASGEGNMFGGAPKPAGGEASVFGAASRTQSGAGSVFGGASRAASGEGSMFGAAIRSVIKQETSQQSSPQRPSTTGVSQPPSSQFGASHTFGKFPAQTEIGSTTSTTQPSSSVFGGKSNFASAFGGARQPQGSEMKVETTSSVFGGSQSNVKKESHRSQPLFPAIASRLKTGSEAKIKQESGHSGDPGHHTATSNVIGFLKAGASASASGPYQSQKRSAGDDEEGGTDSKRGRTEKEDQDDTATESSPERSKLRRSSSTLEDVASKTSICCKGISPKFNKGSVLRNHFSRFGVVKRVRPVPAKQYAIIQFETHEEASKAKKRGADLPGHGKPMSIFWKSSADDKSPVSSKEAAQGRSTWKRSGAEAGKGASSLLSGTQLPSSVAAELASMGGADSDACGAQAYQTQDQSAGRMRSGREERSSSPVRRDPAQRTRSRTPPPSSSLSLSSSSSSTLPTSSASSLGKTTNVTLSSLRKMIATTTMEKVNVLDTRDKLMRQKLGRQTGGGLLSRAFVGTCPDMCPEKERLYREEVRRLSIYEIIPGSSTLTGSTSLVDHTKAVKEYSRSSADQDEPLPHELRPLPVLTMTMNYLLVEVAECGEDGKWAEWYDFLWNRTRSIRKEITQQQLCSQEVVDLLEKCVRFHIYCSERLCTEDMMVFDSKINDENLTKCLQTLKELYADMENKHGTFCPNEAEFRAYIVLMNLNEGDTLREVQQLRTEVRASAEIGFAVKAYSALNSNNYVRFFRLVRTAPFLNACILHRYFNQIRARALQIILRSHTAGQKKVGFLLSEFQRLLAFESEGDVREFCSYYGLQADGADLSLDRSAFVEPETSLPLWRAEGLVESKRFGSVGEVINGGPLQAVSLPTPQCSFDEQGRFIGSLEGLVDDGGQEAQDKVKPFAVKAAAKPPQLQPSPLLPQTNVTSSAAVPGGDVSAVSSSSSGQASVSGDAADGKQQWKPSSEVLKTIARDLFFEVIDQHAREVAQSVISAQAIMRTCEADIASEMTLSVVADLARQVSREVVEAETVRHNQLLVAEQQERETRVAADVLTSIVNTCVEEQAEEIALEEIREAEAMEEEERRERCTLTVQSELLLEVVGEVAGGVADEVHQTDVVARLQLLADLQRAVELRRASQWLAVWRKALKLRQRQKRAMLDFPCAPPMQTPSLRLQSMYPDRPDHVSPLQPGKAALLVNHRARMTLLSPFESEQRSLTLTAHLSLASLMSSLQRMRAWQPLNLGRLLRGPLNMAIQQWPRCFVNEHSPLSVQWKLLLSLPGEMEEEEDEDKEGDKDDTLPGGPYTPSHLMPVLKQWLCTKFTHGDSGASSSPDSSKRNVLSQYSIEVASNTAAPPKLRVGVCVRTVPEFGRRGKKEQPTREQSLSVTKGTNAILFLLPHADTSDDTVWLAARLRLARLLEAKPVVPPTPLALLLPCGLGTAPGSLTEEVTARMGVPEFQDQGLVSDAAVVELAVCEGQLPDTAIAAPALQTQVTEAVRFLASKLPEPADLRRERLGDLVEGTLTQHFFTPVLQDLRCRLRLNKLHQAPNTLIGLYNSVLDHVCLALTSPSLQDVSWPAPELQLSASTRHDWNSKEHLGDIYELVSSLRLPWFHYKDPASTEWSQVCHDVWTFVNAVVKKRCDSAVSLTSRVSRVLAHTCLQFENLCTLTQNEDHCTPTYVNAPWTDIVVACAEFRLQRLHNWKDEEEDVGGDVEVLFEEEDLEEFEPPASWVQALLDTEDPGTRRVEDTVEQASILHCAHHQPAMEQDDLASSLASHRHSADDDDGERGSSSVSPTGEHQAPLPPCRRQDLPDNVRSALETSEKLLLHVGEERRKAQAFERYLQKALRGDTPPEVNFSTILPSPLGTTTTPRLADGATPALSSVTAATTPFRPLSAVRQAQRDAWASSTPSIRRAHLPLRPSTEPRRLTVPGRRAEQFAGGEEGAEEEKSRQECLPLSEGVEQFKEKLQAQRHASELFEKRLQSLLES